MPLISVIVPVYKVEKYLNRCVDSILAQTFTDFELILIDDGSPDNCGKICDEYEQKDSRIHTIHQKNGGLSSARNSGIDWVFQNSDSQWLTFIDSDDWVHPQYLDLLLSAANTHSADISICEYTEIDKYFISAPVNDSSAQKLTPEEIFVCRRVTATIACAKLYKKICFKDIRYPAGKLHEDEFTTYKILFQKSHISYLNENLYFYYTNPNSIVRSEWSPKRLDAIEALEEQIAYFQKKHYVNALKNAKEILLWSIISQIEAIKTSENYKHFASKLKKKLKLCVKEYKKDLNLSIKTNSNIYETLYPKRTKIYWVFVSLLRKLNTRR